jgi:hypothetical protein
MVHQPLKVGRTDVSRFASLSCCQIANALTEADYYPKVSLAYASGFLRLAS